MMMIGLDTNVLVRLLTNDDLRQRQAALAFAEGLGEAYIAFVSLLTLVELDWALRTRLRYSRQDVVRSISLLLQARGMVFEHHDLVAQALGLVSRKNVDFADALIAARALQAGCQSVKTFDRKAAARVPGMELLA
ncbi:PIN domain-containing protein [Rhizobium oryzicola]|uniref:Ribonuclease VapC n=1 Tax=Rhizobium oryzicola TaxID=1232668 RepID=A0ABT8SVI3_9HYPH|nr:type II toxin-antitoxin system VapC family toxin [Rhizobium oryzicola]MDO1582051.1 type II toxin-antitoxin system VapC family toxin [Rhizobium oryzicola]